MKLFFDHEFTLVTQKSLAECTEMLKQIGLYAELMGCKVKKKKSADAADDGRRFAYKYRGFFTPLKVTGNIEPYEQPYTGCRIPVCVSEGTDNTVVNLFVFYVIMPLLFMGAVLEGEYGFATFLVVLAGTVLIKWLLIDVPAKKRAQDLLAQIFHATVEPVKKERHDEA